MALMVKDKIIYGSIKEVPSFGFTPVGTVIAVMGNTAPNHYLICNGQEVSIKSYPELALYFNEQFGSINHFGGDGTTTFCVPDLRGEFLRGTGTNSHTDQGDGADVGEHQDGTVFPFMTTTSTGNISVYTNIKTGGASILANEDKYKSTSSTGYRNLSGGYNNINSSYSDRFTARPTNTSVLYCIAVHDIYIDARYNYSLEEQMVGRWIDGKPIYQKTIVRQNPPDNFDFADNVDIVTDLKGTVKAAASSSSVEYHTLDYTHPNYTQYSFTVFVQDGKLSFRTNSSGYSSSSITLYVTAQYTKTTD